MGVKCAGGRGNTTHTPEAYLALNFIFQSPLDESSITKIIILYHFFEQSLMSSVVTTAYTARLLPNMRQRFTRRRGGEHLLKTLLYTGSHWAQLVTTIGSYYSVNDTS